MSRRLSLTALLAALVALALAAPAAASPVLVYDDGQVTRVDDPALPAPQASNPLTDAAHECITDAAAPTASAAAVTTVRKALQRAYRRGDIDRDAYSAYGDVYSRAKHAWHRLSGSRRSELGSV